MKIIKPICFFIIITLAVAPAWTAEADHDAIRMQARTAYQDGNWNDAYQLYRKLSLEVINDH